MRVFARLSLVELKLFLREPLSVVFAFAFPLFMLFVLAGVFGNELETDDPESVRIWRGVAPTDYYQPAYVALVMAAVGMVSLPLRLAAYREQGVLRRFRAAGIPALAIAGSQAVVGLLMMVAGGLAITVASRAVYGTFLPQAPFLFVAAWGVSAVTFVALGVLLGSVLPGVREAQGAGIILFVVMMMISGAGPPQEVLNGPMRAASQLLPLTHAVLLVQATWLGDGWDWLAFAVLAGFLAGGAVLAARLFRWE